MVVARVMLALFQWAFPMEDASWIVLLSPESDRRIEAAEDLFKQLSAVEGTASGEDQQKLERFIEQSQQATGIAPGILRARLDRSRLNRKYPLGYVVFASDGAAVQSYRPNEEMVSLAAFLETPILNPDSVILTTPDITFRALNSTYGTNTIRLPRKEGARDAFAARDDVLLWAEILANSNRGLVWVLGLRRESRVALPNT